MIKLATVFSGIGAIEHALERMNIEHKIIFACDNGDVDVLSQNVECNIEHIDNTINLLEKQINMIAVLNNKDKEYVEELREDLEKVIILFREREKKISKINSKFLNLLKEILVVIKENNQIKKTKYKEYCKCYDELVKSKSSNQILIGMMCSIKLISDFTKDNSFENHTDDKLFESSYKINWNDIYFNLLEIFYISEKEEFKKNIKNIKDIAEKLSMLHERIKSNHISKKLESIESYDEKKDFIDGLYKGKEKQNKVRESYLSNYNIDEKNFHWNVSFLDGNQYKDEVDLFVGGSPCQSFSLVGKQRGLEDTRGTLFYEYARLIKEIQPKIFIYENVKAVLSNDEGRTWKTMQQVFTDLNYTWHQTVLNAKDFGIPQNRERLFVVGFRNDLNLKTKFEFPKPVELNKKMQDFLLDNVSGKYYLPEKGVKFVTSEKNILKRYTQIDGEVQLCQKKNQQFNWHGDFVFVEENKDMEKTMKDLEKYFLSEKVKKYVLSTGTKGFYSKPKTDLEVARPLLTTMHKMHRAGVDNYVTTEGRLRKLTPRECLRLMGFCDSFNINVSDTAMYQQAGNSIVVDVLKNIMNSIIKSYPNLLEEE